MMPPRPDPLAPSRGLFVGTCGGLAITSFVTGGLFAATGSETVAVAFMGLAFVLSVLAMIVGGRAWQR